MSNRKKRVSSLVLSLRVGLTLLLTGPVCGFWSEAEAGDEADAVATVEAYHRALSAQDSSAAVGLLAEDALVLESGHVETLEEYLGHHLGADMQFAAEVSSERTVLSAVVSGEVAWVASSSNMDGSFRGQKIRSAGVELMVLSKINGSWKIRAIHWSSRRINTD